MKIARFLISASANSRHPLLSFLPQIENRAQRSTPMFAFHAISMIYSSSATNRYIKANIMQKLIYIFILYALPLLPAAHNPRELFEHIRFGREAEMRAILEEHPEWLETKDTCGCTPLCIALQHKKVGAAQSLLTCNANINAIDNTGTSLFFYAQHPRGDINECIACCLLLLQNGYPKTEALVDAAKFGFIEMLEMLLNEGIPVDGANAEGFTAIEVATGCRQIEAVRILLKHDVDISIYSGFGRGAMGWGKFWAQRNKPEILQMLTTAQAAKNEILTNAVRYTLLRETGDRLRRKK